MPASLNDDIAHLLRSAVVCAEPQRLVWPPPWVGHIPFAFWVIEQVRPGCLVELGTHTGNSYCAFLQAAVACDLPLKAYAVDTWEGDPQAGYYGDEIHNALAADHDRLYGGMSRLLRMTFDQALTYFSEGSVDLLHIDGLHTYDAVKHDFDSWLPTMSTRGLVLFHDINVRERDFGVWKLWEEVTARYPTFAFDHSNGLGVAYVGSEPMPDGLRWLIEEVAPSPERLATVRRFFARLGAGLFDRLWSQERARLLDERAAEIRRFSDMVVERDGRLGALYAEVDRLNQGIADTASAHQAEQRALSDEIVARDRRLGELYAEIERLQAAMDGMRAGHEEEAHRLAGMVEERDGRLGLLYPEVDRLNGRIRDLETRLAAVHASSSWRLTAGLRWGTARARRLKGKGCLAARAGLRVARALASRPEAIPGRLAAAVGHLRRHGPRSALRRLIGKLRPNGVPEVDPGALFDRAWYLERNPDVRAAGTDPWAHYATSGAAEGRNPNPLFDTAWYLGRYPDVRAAGCNPLIHYLQTGAAEGRDPGPGFDTDWYLACNPDVARTGVNPLLHYLASGKAEGRAPKPAAGTDVWQAPEPLAPYEAWMSVNRLSRADVAELRAALAERAGRTPTISLVTPVYNTDPALFGELVDSVLAQVYENWELCLADDCSPSPHVAPMLEAAAARDPRIKVTRLPANGGISAATNAAVAMAGGEIVAFLDHDDLITPDCLAELALYYADHPDADIVYSDDDKIDMEGRRYAPQFKPDWSPVLLLSFMYFGHVFSVRRSLFQELGGFRKPFDGSQDYDFALRATERARHVGHVPKILYHWRAAPGSTAVSADGKPASIEAGRRAVEEAMARRGVADVRVTHPDWAAAARCGMFEIRFPDHGPSVTIVIPTKNQTGYLKTCLESLEQTTYRDYDVLVVDNESDDPAAIAYLDSLRSNPRVRVERIPSPGGRFSFANLNNEAVRRCTADYVLFLNNDTKVITPGWLGQMMGYARMPGVGAVGARLYFEDGTIQHAGIVHGYHEGLVGHAFRNNPPHDWGYMGFVRTAREYSGVTAACMLTPRALFEELGGFDEVNFAVAYNDVDYSYRVVRAGRTCVYCSTAELFHFEGKSRGFRDDPQERVNFRRLYGDWHDRWYNPNLSLENERFEPATVRPQTRRTGPVRAVMVTHNLNHEGAPATLMDLTIGLVERGAVSAHVLSPTDGPLRAIYEAAGIAVHILPRQPLQGVHDAATLARAHDALAAWLKEVGAEVVVANTLQTFWAVTAASRAGLPALWCQHESEPWETYFDHLPPALRTAAYGAFAQAYRVLYVAEATRRSWRALDSRRTFQVIRHGIPPQRLAEEVSRWGHADARARLEVGDDELVIEIVGTVCHRKGQIDMVKAFAQLPESVQKRLRVYLVGRVGEADYGEAIAAEIARLPAAVADRVVVTGPVDDPFLYYAAADISVCTSLIESAPRVIVEAMACGLPIITTPVFGIPELVREDVNALFYPAGDAGALAALTARLVEDGALRRRLASKSRAVLDGQPGFAEMVVGYAEVLRQAVNLDAVPNDGMAGGVAGGTALETVS
ncbi:GT2 family glycosyltransferase [Azospirillum brasilense]|uniref:GT2 family glycosyltransferase n=1 Tax=Azospirillum brasilense TaxID=192 RepID=A0A560BWX7_AZOBR|nr:glycosyltransferase [Azospirillum brasilense]TWA77106.1 GT2 family glycosyltransferase [Azospirillum brasilense]